jgi:sugar lactone lactonase YvrE
MGISDRLLGRKNVNGNPHIEAVAPGAALPGGEIRITGSSLRPQELRRPQVKLGDAEAAVVVSTDDFLVARVPAGASSGPVVVSTNGHSSNSHQVKVAVQIAENLHPVTSPALDAEGNIYVTFSGSRGQKAPVAIYKIDTNYEVKPFVAEMMNPTAIAFDREGQMYVSSRFDGTVYRVAPNGTMSSYAESMGVATGIAFDREQNLYVGDRSGTIFKIARDRQIFVFATLEPSVSAYHLAFGPQGDLFVTGPTISSFDCVYKIDVHGTVSTFYRGLGRPQGLAFDVEGNLYVAASLGGKRGIVKITPEAKGSLEVSGNGLVGLAFAPGRSVVLATTDAVHHIGAVYHLSWDIQGLSLPPEAA